MIINTHAVTWIFNALSIIVCLFSIVIGFTFYKQLRENKTLIYIPLASIIQSLLSLLLYTPNIYYKIENVYSKQLMLVSIYTIIEFVLISQFLYNDQKNKKIKEYIKYTSVSIIAIAGIDVILIKYYDKFLSLQYFSSMEGLLIITYILYNIIDKLKNIDINQMFKDSNIIAKFGILLSFFIIWPNSLIQIPLFEYAYVFYKFNFIANSIAYIILFLFFALSFYAARKTRNT